MESWNVEKEDDEKETNWRNEMRSSLHYFSVFQFNILY